MMSSGSLGGGIQGDSGRWFDSISGSSVLHPCGKQPPGAPQPCPSDLRPPEKCARRYKLLLLTREAQTQKEGGPCKLGGSPGLRHGRRTLDTADIRGFTPEYEATVWISSSAGGAVRGSSVKPDYTIPTVLDLPQVLDQLK
ncbi:N-acylneuraminate-9-phosphatase isoform X1 [Lates japonicus]|uniref:N-acylneuraminate-9-phosphatase isoform X1 n=1 Tax=Lates japonicus TaxID=270547 RepID=A0AAD3MKY1_LATJO|nr:N-acylneuraminate-9-phosphatase isoform X1 [Lates japonicus]